MAASAPIQPSQLAALLSPGLAAIAQQELEGVQSLFKRQMLFNTKTTVRAYEEHQNVGALDANNWDFRRSGEVSYEGLNLGYKTRFTPREFSKGIAMDRPAVEDNLYGGESGLPTSLTETPKKLTLAAERFKEKMAADVINGGFTDSGTRLGGFSYAGADGVGLLSTAHPYSPSDTGSTQTNEGTSGMTPDNLDATIQAMRAFTDDVGELVAISPDTLLVPPELGKDARILLMSELEPGHANNDKNVAGARIKNLIEWDFLTDATAWFVIDSALSKQCLYWYDRTGTEYGIQYNQNRHVYEAIAYWRSVCGWSDWRWIYGQNA